jgi:hypothetical protein
MTDKPYSDLIARISSGMTTSEDAQLVADMLARLEELEQADAMAAKLRAIDELMRRIEEMDA